MIETNFDYSMLRAFHSCQRKYYYLYGLSIVPRQSVLEVIPGAMEFGSSIDAGLDFAYQILSLSKDQQQKYFEECFRDAEYRPNRMQTVAFTAATNVFKSEWGTVVNKGYSADLGLSLIEEYFSRYFPEPFDTIDSQISGPVPLKDLYGYEINLQIKADRLVWGYDPNRYSIFEVKTTGNPNDVWWTGQEMSYQVDGYVMGVEVYHDVSVHSAVIDCLATKRKKDRLIRRPILITTLRRKLYREWLMNSISKIMQMQIETMQRYGHKGDSISEACMSATLEGGRPHSKWLENRSNCTEYFRVCAYQPLCDLDCHPGALSNYTENPWRPYMPK